MAQIARIVSILTRQQPPPQPPLPPPERFLKTLGDPLFSNRVVKDSRVLIRGLEFRANLVVLDMRDFDVVFGMDWLSRHRATLDCYKKEVKFHRPGKFEVKFRGIHRKLSSSMISTMAVQRMLRKGCQGYLAYVVETGKEGTLVEFTIDLILRTKPISIFSL